MSDTYQQAQTIADRLLLAGVKPTQQRLRDELGRGSLSTINRALNDWWAQLGERLAAQQQLPDLPPAVADAMRQLWEAAAASARRDACEHQQQLEQQVRRSRAAVKAMQREADEEKSRHVARLEQLSDANQRLQEENAALVREQLALERQALELEKRCASLERTKLSAEAVIEKLESRLVELESATDANRLHALQQENANLRKALERLDAQR